MRILMLLLLIFTCVACGSSTRSEPPSKQLESIEFLDKHGNDAMVIGFKTVPGSPNALRKVLVKFKDGTEAPVRFGRNSPGIGEVWTITLEPGTHDLMLWNLK